MATMSKNFEIILRDIRKRRELMKGSLHEEMLDLELADIKEVICKPIKEVLNDEEWRNGERMAVFTCKIICARLRIIRITIEKLELWKRLKLLRLRKSLNIPVLV